MIPLTRAVVEDGLFEGTLVLLQPARGYRVNVDTLLLASFAAKSCPKARRLVDLGAGVGALALATHHFGEVVRADLVEREPALAALAERNLRAARLDGAVHVADLGRGLPAALTSSADAVVCNPPFFGAGSSNDAPSAALRRSARSGRVEPFLLAAARAMGRRSRAFFVYPAAALTEFFLAARDVGLVPKRLRLVHAYANATGRVALVELKRAKPGGLVVEPPLIEWSAPRVRAPELAAIVEGRLTTPAPTATPR